MDPDNLIERNKEIYCFVTKYLTGLWRFVNNFINTPYFIDPDVESLLSFVENRKYFDLVIVRGYLYCWYYRNVFDKEKAIFIVDEADKGLVYPSVENPVFISRKIFLSDKERHINELLFVPVNSVRWRLKKIVYDYTERGSVRNKTIYL